jgi:hypothetical protein
MIQLSRFALSMLILFTISCGGGGSSGDTIVPGGNQPSNTLVGSFSAENSNPTDLTVCMSEISGGSNSLVVVGIDVTGTDDIFGANFEVTYDPQIANFVNWSPGSLLEYGGQQVIYQIVENTPGLIVIGIARAGGDAGGVNVTSTATLVRLTFQVTDPGSCPVGFQGGSFDDGALDPIPGLSWHGGTLVAN